MKLRGHITVEPGKCGPALMTHQQLFRSVCLGLFSLGFIACFGLVGVAGLAQAAARDSQTETECSLRPSEVSSKPASFSARAGDEREFTWWLPPGAEEYVLPISAGMIVQAGNPEQMAWLRQGSPWSLSQLPAFGARYGERMLVVIVPWPHYAGLVTQDRVGVRFAFPEKRNNTTPCELVAQWAGPEPLEIARVFREWRERAKDTGAVPPARSLAQKAAELPSVSRLFGAPHIYLWGPAMFSRHDVPRNKWVPLAKALRDAPDDSEAARLGASFSSDQRRSRGELAGAEWPMNYLVLDVAQAIDAAMASRGLLGLKETTALPEVTGRNRALIVRALAPFANPPETWGDGLSITLLNNLHDAGIDRALLLLSDLYAKAVRPDVAARAGELGYLLGPYDSYHSVHSPGAPEDQTWETAQFDETASTDGRVLRIDGQGHGGFRGRGYHLAPSAAWPYVERRVDSVLRLNPYSAWFVDCDATAECFDDYHPLHPATRVDDINARRRRLRWLETEKRLVVGSEDGSVLFADVIHLGHGVQTPYLGHLDPAFRDQDSPHFLGRRWPPDSPEQSFKPVPVPPSLRWPYFDPRARLPLYQAALGDQVVVSHHWSFDSFKFSDLAADRELMEILYLVPPLYHLNRETWPQRKNRITRHFSFWSPLHRQLATAPLTRFECLTKDRLVQRTTFRHPAGDVTLTVNFSTDPRSGLPPRSATVGGPVDVTQKLYQCN